MKEKENETPSDRPTIERIKILNRSDMPATRLILHRSVTPPSPFNLQPSGSDETGHLQPVNRAKFRTLKFEKLGIAN